MTDLKFAILGILYGSFLRTEDKTNISNLVSPLDPNPVPYALKELEKQGYISSLPCSNKVKLTPDGTIAYEQANEDRKKQAKQERQQRFENKISVASVLVPLITFFLGIIVESQVNIVDWLLSFFK